MWKEGLGLLFFFNRPRFLETLISGTTQVVQQESMKVKNVFLTLGLTLVSAYVVTELIPAINDNRRYREGLKELDRARSKMNRIKNQVMPDSEAEALRASYELQGRLEYIQDHYGIDSETIDAQVGTELYRMIESLKK